MSARRWQAAIEELVMARNSDNRQELQTQIDGLKDKLHMARRTIIDMSPARTRHVLTAWIWCETNLDVGQWRVWAVDQLIELADARPGVEMGDWPNSSRAYCPLCGEGAQTPYSKGFSIPLGLERHLRGSHQSFKCAVLEAAEGLAYERVRDLARKDAPNWTAMPGGKQPPPWRVPKVQEHRDNVVDLRRP